MTAIRSGKIAYICVELAVLVYAQELLEYIISILYSIHKDSTLF